ncbi:MAG: hypothetical protein D6683_16495 [Actinomyces sp.]|nr:MAG: hypothetical protein D6683_16495 [Actinomyces sp.]
MNPGSEPTALDRAVRHPGYHDSAWPVECGGNRRQKARTGRLDAGSGRARVVTRRDERWHVMAIERDPDQWYLTGTRPAFTGPPPHGWVERIDPETLEPRATSPDLPCGDHVWCGAVLAHADGSIHVINGSYLHRLDPDTLEVLAERRLPVDHSHNGLLALADGTLVTKDLRLEGQGPTTITRLRPDTLELVGDPLVLPEGSMGRIAADLVDAATGLEHVYVPGTDHVWRLVVDGDELIVDDWRARYRPSGADGGLAWDACLSDGACWIMDCGDVESVRLIHRAHPNGRFPRPPGRALSWRRPAPWSAPVRLVRIALDDPTDVRAVAVTGHPGGGIIAPPVHIADHDRAVAWDSINGGLCGFDTSEPDRDPEPVWQLEVRPSMQPVVFPDSGELVINDFTPAGRDEIVVVDLVDGTLIDRVDTGSRIANGMFLSAGGHRDVYYCTTTMTARIVWE